MNEYITLIGAPLMAIIGGIITWFLKARKEELQTIEERALERRIETYNQILDPIIVLFSNGATEKEKNDASEKIISIDYYKSAFNLMTFGSDEMVNSYNEMMQSIYKNEEKKNPEFVLKKFAGFLLAIRKDVYKKDTSLKDWDMLKFMITDIDSIIDKY